MNKKLLPMSSLRIAKVTFALSSVALMSACATPRAPYNYDAFRQNRPVSLLVLPPLNESKDVKATAGVLATATLPLAEAGYYVMPVSLVDETFKQNGLSNPADIHEVSLTKLREIFGADAAVYMRVKQYGTTYMIVGSETRVTIEGRIVDLRSGRVLWEGQATSSSQESDTSNQAGLAGLLIKALVTQIVGTVSDASFNYASISNNRLLGAPRKDGILLGPRSPNYQKD